MFFKSNMKHLNQIVEKIKNRDGKIPEKEIYDGFLYMFRYGRIAEMHFKFYFLKIKYGKFLQRIVDVLHGEQPDEGK